MSNNLKIVSLVVIFIMLIIILLFFSVKNENDNIGDKKVIAVAIVPEKEFIQVISGEDFEIVTMVPAGASPENYEPTPIEMQKFEKASIYFSMGVPAEISNILPNINDNTKLVKLDEEVRNKYNDLTFENGGRDPHIWLSPQRVMVIVQKVADELSLLNPKGKEKYQENAFKYIEELKSISLEIQTIVQRMENKKFIVYHPAFAYLADEFGLEMYALEEEGKEATAESLKEKIDLAKTQGIKYIFYQAEIDSNQSKAFAEEINGQTMMLEPLAENYIENLKKMAELLAK